MKVGFMQAAMSYQARGYYDNEVELESNKEQGLPLRDLSQLNPGPWYSIAPFHVFFDPSEVAPGNVKTHSVNDTPALVVPLTYDRGAMVEDGDDILDRLDIRVQFRLDVAVESTDSRSRQPDDKEHTRRATALWRFDALGTIDESNYDYLVDESAGVFVPEGWTPVEDGSRPITTGTTIYDHVKSQQFGPP
jgi:hypothetical protein